MSSARRLAASRANGKESQGPVTSEGKARSAANAPTRHGLASPNRAGHSVCLNYESRDGFLLLHDTLVTKHAPVTATEHLAVHEHFEKKNTKTNPIPKTDSAVSSKGYPPQPTRRTNSGPSNSSSSGVTGYGCILYCRKPSPYAKPA